MEKSNHSEEVKGQQGAEDLNEFNPDRWVRQLEALAQKPNELDVDAFIEVLHETLNLFKKMGSALSLAFSGTNTLSKLMLYRHFDQG